MLGMVALRRGLLLAATLVMVGGCDGGVAPAVDASRCAVPDYPAALSRTIDEIQIWAGNRRPMLRWGRWWL